MSRKIEKKEYFNICFLISKSIKKKSLFLCSIYKNITRIHVEIDSANGIPINPMYLNKVNIKTRFKRLLFNDATNGILGFSIAKK